MIYYSILNLFYKKKKNPIKNAWHTSVPQNLLCSSYPYYFTCKSVTDFHKISLFLREQYSIPVESKPTNEILQRMKIFDFTRGSFIFSFGIKLSFFVTPS